uniref:Mitochondrial S-adenosylmethionine carrier protein n=2 Tax=Canis lupus familiaris TaxID=9615 RepID=A0A8I3NAS5_CANLF
ETGFKNYFFLILTPKWQRAYSIVTFFLSFLFFFFFLKAGGVAGVAVDLILFPLDTIKTRLQSPQGFNKAGGFRGIYAGVPSAAIGSFPNAAAFFITYEYVKWFLHTDSSSYLMPVKHMLAASAGEVILLSDLYTQWGSN